MPDCKPGILDSSFLASPEFMVLAFHVVTVITIPILTFGFFCILFKTPNKMKAVKILLLNVHFWGTLSDLTICFLGVPYAYFPVLAGYGLGVVDAPELLLYSAVSFAVALTAGIISIFENRYFILFGQNSFWKLVRKPYLVFLYSSIPLYFLPPYVMLPDQENARRIALSTLPCLPAFTYSNRSMIVIALDNNVTFICVVTACVFLFTSFMFFFILNCYNMISRKLGIVHSVKTIAAQKRFLIAVTIQTIVSSFLVLLPTLLIIFIISAWYHNQKLNNLCCLLMSLHGTGSTIVMILAYKPYRDFTFSLVSQCGNGPKKSVIVLNAIKLPTT